MPLIQNLICPNGSYNTYHVCIGVEIKPLKTIAVMHSFPDEAAFLNRFQPQWSWSIVIRENFLNIESVSTLDKAEIACITAIDTPFITAAHIVRTGLDLKAAREKKWADMKAMRNMLELRSFPWNGKRFDSNLLSATRIATAATEAQYAVQHGDTNWTVNWKLADNTMYALNANEMQAVQSARYHYMAILQNMSDALYAKIFDPALTIEQVQAIQWDAIVP